ncbi:MAG: putative hydrolase [Dehalococcoidia bacterium]|nr:putative hydrolase [Dehalococcoidia bacterium]
MEPRTAFVQIPDVRIHYTDWGGSGPPLVLLHGGRLTGRSWDAVARGLSSDFHVIAMDARGHGDSDKPARGYSYDQRLTDLDRFLDAMSWKQAFGMSHSTGAMAMALHGVKHPGRLTKLVLIEPPARPFRPDAPARAEGQPAAQGAGRAGGARNAPAQQRRGWPSRPELEAYLRAHPETGLWREDVLMDVVREGAAALPDGSVEMKWSPNAYNPDDQALNTYSLVQEAPNIKVPTFLMYGTRGIGQEEGYRAFAKGLPQSKLMIVEGAGHNIYMEDPDLVINAVRSFLKSGFAKPAAGGYEETRNPMTPGRVLGSAKAVKAAVKPA